LVIWQPEKNIQKRDEKSMHFHLKGQSYKYHKHGNRTLQIDQYAVQSGLAYVNPDCKLFAGICSLLLCLLSRYGIMKESIRAAMLISTKAMCSITCLYMISLSTPVHEIIGVLYKCKIPKIMIELMYFVYRFIFILLESYHNMKTAADTRLGYINLKRSYDSFFVSALIFLLFHFKRLLEALMPWRQGVMMEHCSF
jgi:energy-coupling factor transporter transmembrane protein EcfT